MEHIYDKVQWSFLLSVLRYLGFSKKWIQIISQCMSLVSYSILLNGILLDWFKPSRGLRQGDPLSPFPFIIGTEVLSKMITRKEGLGNVQQTTTDSLANILGIGITTHLGKYLGLPLIPPHSKRQAHLELKEELLKRLSGWKSKLLPQAGLVCLIKSVVSALPTYFMSNFLLPNRYCLELDSLMRYFWWGFP